MIYLYFAIVFYIGLFAGIILQRWLRYRTSVSGVIKVTVGPEKTLFSLELADNPDMIAYKDEVIFKVETSEDNIDRE